MKLPVLSQHDTQGADSCSCSTASYTMRPGVTRRSFLRSATAATGAVAAIAASLSPLRELKDTDEYSVEKFLQKHYK